MQVPEAQQTPHEIRGSVVDYVSPLHPCHALPLLYPSLGGKVVPESFSGETHTGEMLQASILTNIVCAVPFVMTTVSRFAMRGQSPQCTDLPRGAESPRLVYVGFHLRV